MIAEASPSLISQIAFQLAALVLSCELYCILFCWPRPIKQKWCHFPFPFSLFPLHSSLSSLNFTPLTLPSLFAGRYFHNQHIGTHSDLLNKNSFFPLTNSLILIPSPSLSTRTHFFPSSLLFRLNSSSTLFFFFFFHHTHRLDINLPILVFLFPSPSLIKSLHNS